MDVAAGVGDGIVSYVATNGAVRRLLGATSLAPGTVLGHVAPAGGVLTVERLAVAGAQAGCAREQFPVLLAAARAMLDDESAVGAGFNVAGVQATACSCAPVVIVSGEVVRANRWSAPFGVLGVGAPGLVPIGRALRLVLRDLGAGYAGISDMSIVGQPFKLGYAFAEDEASPYAPLHRARGLRSPSGVTVFGAEPPSVVELADSDDPLQHLRLLAATMSQLGSLNSYWPGGEAMVVINLQLARLFRRAGWRRADLTSALYELAKRPEPDHAQRFAAETRAMTAPPPWSVELGTMPVVRSPEAVHLVVAGRGEGYEAAVCPGWGAAGGFAMTVGLPTHGAGVVGDDSGAGVVGDDSGAEQTLLDAPYQLAAADVGPQPVPLASAARPGGDLLVLLNYQAGPDSGADEPMVRLVEALTETLPFRSVRWLPSETPTMAEDPSSLAAALDGCSAAVVGTALSGARSWKVVCDAVAIERAGVPAVVLVAGPYEEYVVELGRRLGHVELPRVPVPVARPDFAAVAAQVGAAVAAALREREP